MAKPDRLGMHLLNRALSLPSDTVFPDDPLDLLTHEERMELHLREQAKRLDRMGAELAEAIASCKSEQAQ